MKLKQYHHYRSYKQHWLNLNFISKMALKMPFLVVLLIALVSTSEAKRGKDFVEGGEVKPGKTQKCVAN